MRVLDSTMGVVVCAILFGCGEAIPPAGDVTSPGDMTGGGDTVIGATAGNADTLGGASGTTTVDSGSGGHLAAGGNSGHRGGAAAHGEVRGWARRQAVRAVTPVGPGAPVMAARKSSNAPAARGGRLRTSARTGHVERDYAAEFQGPGARDRSQQSGRLVDLGWKPHGHRQRPPIVGRRGRRSRWVPSATTTMVRKGRW